MAKRLSPGFSEGPLGNGPGFEDATDFKAQIVMEAPRPRAFCMTKIFSSLRSFFAAPAQAFSLNRRLATVLRLAQAF